MAASTCDVCCQPTRFGRNQDTFQSSLLTVNCNILAAIEALEPSVRYDWEVLCDPSTGDPVLLRFEYDTDGTVVGVTAYNADGSAYGGVIADLVACDSSEGIPVSNAIGFRGEAIAQTGYALIGADAVEAGSTTTVLNLTGHVARVGDAIRYRSGAANTDAWAIVIAADANSITLNAALPAVPVVADNISILRPVPITAYTGAAGNNANGYGLGVVISIDNQPVSQDSYLLKAEDAPHSSGAAGVMSLGVNNRSYAAFNATQLDYTPIGVSDFGNVLSTPTFDPTLGGATPVRLEDTAFAASHAVMVVGSQRQDTPSVDTSADGDVQTVKGNAFGALYVDTAWGVPAYQYNSVAFGSVPAAFGTLLSPSGKIRHMRVLNLLNTDIEISYDATNVHDYIPAGQTLTIPFAEMGRFQSGTISYRYVAVPASGSVKIATYR